MKISKFTAEQYVKVYEMSKAKKPSHEIVMATGLKESQIYTMFHSIKKQLRKSSFHKLVSQEMREAVHILKIIKSNESTTNEQQPEQKTNGIAVKPIENTQETDLAALDHAFSHLQETIVTVIENESNRRSEGKVRGIKEKYETELQKMQAVIVEAQNSSVVGLLRKKWGLSI